MLGTFRIRTRLVRNYGFQVFMIIMVVKYREDNMIHDVHLKGEHLYYNQKAKSLFIYADWSEPSRFVNIFKGIHLLINSVGGQDPDQNA